MTSLDTPFLDKLRALRPRPILIAGLHRSGTTFLYETLARLLRVAPVTIYHVRHYQELLDARATGREAALQREIDAGFREQGLETRLADSIPLSHATVEEYGWILKRYSGSFAFNRRTAPLFSELCAKLLFLKPEADAVLLKNPWDTGRAPAILKSHPDARFVFLRRDALGILDSQLRNAVRFGARRDPLLHFLTEGIPAVRSVIGGQRLLYLMSGERRYCRVLAEILAADIARELAALKVATLRLPRESFIEIDYAELTSRPAETLTRVVNFLGLPLVGDLASVRPEPVTREPLPEVREAAGPFTRLLAKLSPRP